MPGCAVCQELARSDMVAPATRNLASRRSRWGLIAFGYGALVVYGSLYPFSDWVGGGTPFGFLFDAARWERRPSLGDIVTNLLAYVPLGFFSYRYWRSTHSGTLAAALAILAATALSLGVEVFQGYLPARDQSSVDLLLNVLSASAGVGLARLPSGEGRLARRLRHLYVEWLMPGDLTLVGLLALAAWVITQLLPFVPSLDVGKFRTALAPLERAVTDPTSFNGWHALAETLSRMSIGVIAFSIVRRDKPAFSAFALSSLCCFLRRSPSSAGSCSRGTRRECRRPAGDAGSAASCAEHARKLGIFSVLRGLLHWPIA